MKALEELLASCTEELRNTLACLVPEQGVKRDTHSLPTFALAFAIADLLEPECKMNCTAKGIRIEGCKAGQGYVIDVVVNASRQDGREANAGGEGREV